MPLTGIKIVDLTRIISGPFCTMLLADFGADVIKIEPLRGDDARNYGLQKEGENPSFVNLNRSKRSIAVDLRTAEGKEIVRRLVKGADVLVENFRPGVTGKMGLGYEDLKKINSRLIYAAINGFGKTGPYKDRPAFDFIAQAMSGFMSVNGSKDMDPIRAGIPITDTIAGLYCAFGIMVALRKRDQTGEGEEIQASMLDGMISMLSFAASHYFSTGELPPRNGNDHMIVSPYGVFKAADGPIAVAPSSQKTWLSLCKELGIEHLTEDPRFITNQDRVKNRKEINDIVNQRMQSLPRSQWIEHLNDAGVPCGPINNLKEVFSDPQVLHQEMVLESAQPAGPVKMTGFPVKLTQAPAKIHGPSPQIGEHNREVLMETGYSDAEIGQMERDSVIASKM